jgi:hypothetical protein
MPLARLAVVVLAVCSSAVGAASAASATRRPVEVPRVTAGDTDGDGLPEASVSGVAGGPCACRCPVMGGEAGASAAGQVASAGTGTALIVCGTRVAVATDPSPPDVHGTPRADGRLKLDPGGVGQGGPAG